MKEMTIEQFNELKPQWVWRWEGKSLKAIECQFGCWEEAPTEISFYVDGDFHDGMAFAEDLFSRGEIFASVEDFAEWILAAGESDD